MNQSKVHVAKLRQVVCASGVSKVQCPASIEDAKSSFRVNELEVVNSEVASLRPTAKVYRQHGNGVFFLVNKAEVTSELKATLSDAKQKLENAEKASKFNNGKL